MAPAVLPRRPPVAIEVRVRGKEHVRTVVTADGRWIPVLGLGVVIALFVLSALRVAPIELRCGRDERACVVTGRGEAPRRIPLEEVRSFEVRSPSPATAELHAVTAAGSAALVRGWSASELQRHAEALNGLLRDEAGAPRRFTYDHRREHLEVALGVIGLWAVFFCSALGLTGPFRVRLDRRRGTAIRSAWPLRSRRPLAAFRALQVRSRLDRRAERALQLVLVAADGTAWPLTRFHADAALRTDLDAVAAELSAFLGLQVTRPPAGAAPERSSQAPPGAAAR